MVEVTSSILIYIYATVGLIIILLIWNAYLAWRTKRILQKQIQYETQQQAPAQNYQQQYQAPSYPY